MPKSAIILGGGVIGVEFASAWKSFGADVTVIEGLKHLVPVEDENSSKLLERAFRKRGIKFNLGTFFSKAEYTADGVKVTLADGKEFEAEILLVAVGRGPVSAGLGYEEQGVATDRGYVLVDEYMRTNVPTISAVGDLVPTLQLAHVGFAEGILVAERLAGLKTVPIDYDGVPRVTYCHPEVASVGITEAKAKEIYGADKVVALKYNLAGNGKSKILNTAGEIKLVQVKDGAVVGVHMVGDRMGEQVARPSSSTTGKRCRPRWPSSSTPTRRRTRRSARPTWPWRASRCTRTTDPSVDEATTQTSATRKEQPKPWRFP